MASRGTVTFERTGITQLTLSLFLQFTAAAFSPCSNWTAGNIQISTPAKYSPFCIPDHLTQAVIKEHVRRHNYNGSVGNRPAQRHFPTVWMPHGMMVSLTSLCCSGKHRYYIVSTCRYQIAYRDLIITLCLANVMKIVF